jgi:predicted amidohydrolase YtcJ
VNFDDQTLESFLLPALHGPKKRRQRLFHAVGDGAIDRVLDAAEATGGGSAWHGRRLRIEHGDLIFSENYDRLLDVGAVVVQNPTHFAIPQILAQRFCGPVMSEVQPLATLLQAGIPVAFGSDAFGAPPNPWLDVFLATVHPTRPDEAISVAQAVTAYTRTAAYAEFEDDQKGRLAPGYAADFAMLSANPFTIPPWQMPGITSVLTVVDGEIRWNPAKL